MTKLAAVSEAEDAASIKTFAKNMLKTTLFVGTYQEKRYVESLNEYRDVVKIDKDEEDLIENIKAVLKKIETSSHLSKRWIGITKPETIGAPVGYSLWVVLPEEVFGKYWYKIRNVEFLDNEIRMKLSIIRPYKRECTPVRNVSSQNDSAAIGDDSTANISDKAHTILNEAKSNFMYFLTTVLTFNNIKESFIFVSLLLATISTGSVHVIKYLMEYLLKLIRELNGVIRVSTPIIISIVNMVGRTIYGFYSLIYALFKQQPKVYAPPQNTIQYPGIFYENYTYPRRLALPQPRHRSSVKITPLD